MRARTRRSISPAAPGGSAASGRRAPRVRPLAAPGARRRRRRARTRSAARSRRPRRRRSSARAALGQGRRASGVGRRGLGRQSWSAAPGSPRLSRSRRAVASREGPWRLRRRVEHDAAAERVRRRDRAHHERSPATGTSGCSSRTCQKRPPSYGQPRRRLARAVVDLHAVAVLGAAVGHEAQLGVETDSSGAGRRRRWRARRPRATSSRPTPTRLTRDPLPGRRALARARRGPGRRARARAGRRAAPSARRRARSRPTTASPSPPCPRP